MDNFIIPQKYLDSLNEKGIQYEIQKNGSVLIKKIPLRENILRNFFDGKPTGYPDIDKLYPDYKLDKEANGVSCPACLLADLQKKYRDKLKPYLPTKDVYATNS